MSAYKTAYIRLGEAEYKRLREAEEQLRLKNLLNTNSRSDHSDHANSIYENMMGITKKNEERFQDLVVDLEGEVQRIENEASLWVENQVGSISSDFQKYRFDLEKETSNIINNIVNQANQQIQKKENELQEYWLAHETKINSIENRWGEYAKQAFDWIQKNEQILDFIYDTYLIDAQTANQLELQRQYLNQVIQQYNNNFYDIAASAGFQIYIALSNTRFHLEFNRVLQRIEYQKLLQQVDNLHESIINNQSVHAMDGEGNELPEIINVDYWIEGKYAEFINHAETVFNEIDSDPEIDVKKILDYQDKLSYLNNQIIDLITQARLVVLASQLRFNVAQIVVQALEQQGFFLEQANYEKNDYRESFTAKTCNLAGNEVMVSIEPDPGLDEGGKIHIQSLDADQITRHELIQRNSELFSAIKDNGLIVENIQEHSDSPERKQLPTSIARDSRKENQVLFDKEKNYGRN